MFLGSFNDAYKELDKAKLLLLKLIHLFAREVLIHSLKSKKERLPSLQLLKLVEKKCA